MPLPDEHIVRLYTQKVLQRHSAKTGRLLNVLNDIQDEFRCVPLSAMETISEEMNIPVSRIKALTSFFADLSLEPLGRYVVDICDGTACHNQGAARLIEQMEKALGVQVGHTTEDGQFTLRSVGCVGACGLAPVVMADGQVYGRIKVQQVGSLIDQIQRTKGQDTDHEWNSGSINTSSSLEELKERGTARLFPSGLRITVGMGTCGRAAGADAVFSTLKEKLGQRESSAVLVATGCAGLCYAEPLVSIVSPDGKSLFFGSVDMPAASQVAEFALAFEHDADASLPASLEKHLIKGDPFASQTRRVMENCGVIDPFSLEEYVARGGYSALQSAIEKANPLAILDEVQAACLRGRGGAGFPAGEKWHSVVQALNQDPESLGYLIVNGDEGDPGAYMDRGLLESDPHRVLEGAILACFAMGIHQAFFFVRSEYPQAVKSIEHAIESAYTAGLLGDNILGSNFSLSVSVVKGAGAYLCGESTAMANVLEGKACTARHTGFHMSQRGLWDAPTCINNVETLACVPQIVRYGASWFKQVGTQDSPGTKILSLTGSVEHCGLIEVPLGLQMKEIVYNIAGASNPKAVQIGGPSGAILPVLDWSPVSFEGLQELGGIMGSGGFVVIGQDQCLVDTAAHLVKFSANQSCRTCQNCRECLPEAAQILKSLTEGTAEQADLERIFELGQIIADDKSLCGLGRAALTPVLSGLRHFPEEFEAHVHGECPGLTCRNLISYQIISERCQGERCCLLTCPGNAIKGPFGRAGRIISRLCQKCGMCSISCCYGAVKKVTPAQ